MRLNTAKNDTKLMSRLRHLLTALDATWRSRDDLLATLSDNYPDNFNSARVMLQRDIKYLRELGFEIERSRETRDPHYRLVGHKRFGRSSASF